MLIFANPAWLWVVAASMGLGGWAIWRGQKKARAVSSVRLWQGLGGTTGQARRRAVDPLWVLILVAAVMAAIGLAKPEWVIQTSAQTQDFPIEWSLRSLKAGTAGGTATDRTEAWLHLPDRADSPPSLLLTANGVPHNLTAADLHRGIALRINNAGPRVTLMLQAQGHTLAQRMFLRDSPSARPFALLEQTAAGHAMDPAVIRLFSLQSGARPGDPSLRPVVLLVDNPSFQSSAVPEASLVVALPGTPLPGITLGPAIEAPPQGWTPQPSTDETASAFAWPAYSRLDDVRVSAMRSATFSPDWHIMATANNQPWLAARKWGDSSNPAHQSTLLWLASAPSSQTNWPAIPSFVTFFAEMTTRAFSSFADPATAQNPVTEWHPLETPQVLTHNPPPRIDLARLAGAIAIALIGTAVAWLLWRNRDAREPAA